MIVIECTALITNEIFELQDLCKFSNGSLAVKILL